MFDIRLTTSRGLAALTTLALVALIGCSSNSGMPTTGSTPTADASVLTLVLTPPNLTFVQVPGQPPPPAQVIIASNKAALIPSTGIQIGPTVYTDNLHGGWLSVTPKILGLTASITVKVLAVQNLPLGAYQATFTVKVPGTKNSPVPVTVSFVNGFYFQDGLETGTGWTFTGLWNRSMLGDGICDGERGCLPNPDEGTWAMWYGNPVSGNYQTGGSANSGDAISPVFTIPAGAVDPILKFRTWYEIEYDVSPFSFDFMSVYLVDPTTHAATFVGRLNSMGGFTGHTTSGYVTATIDLSGYTGHSWQLKFDFSTGDGSYNDYRGWIVDRIAVAEPNFFTGINYPEDLRAGDGPVEWTLGPWTQPGTPRPSH